MIRNVMIKLKDFTKSVLTRVIVLLAPVLFPFLLIVEVLFNVIREVGRGFLLGVKIGLHDYTWVNFKRTIYAYAELVPIVLFDWRNNAISEYYDKRYETAIKKMEERDFGKKSADAKKK